MTGSSGGQGPIVRDFPRRGPWVLDAACVDTDPSIFYGSQSGARAARAVCGRCLVAAECLDYALACENADPYGSHGVWAALSGKERNQLRAQMKDLP